MNATERAATLESIERFDEMASVVDEETLEIVNRRRRTAVVHGRGWLVRRTLLAADVFALAAAMVLAELVLSAATGESFTSDRTEILVFLATLPAWVVVAKLYGLYDRDEARTDHSTTDEFASVFHMITVCTWLFVVGAYLTGFAHPELLKLILFWAFAIALVSLSRAAARAISRRSRLYVQNAVIVGAGEIGQLLGKKLLTHSEYGVNLIGFVDSEPKERRPDLDHLTILGPPERLPAIVRMLDVERVIIAFSNQSHEDVLDLMRSIKDLDVQIDVVPRLFELTSSAMSLHTVGGVPLIGLPPLRLSWSSRLLKRAMDLALTVVGLFFLAIPLAVIALAIKIDSPGPALFRQVRMGSHGRTFRIWKFRTMVADADDRKGEVAHLNKNLQNGGDPRMFKIDGDPRVTRLGRFLRRLSLDELPQLFNVLSGEMSLVGPRPLILEEDSHVESWGRHRLDLKPGITGTWQVSGRAEIPFGEMLRLDYVYVTTWSLSSDMRLLLRTIPLVLRTPRGRY